MRRISLLTHAAVKYFLISAPVDWQPDQYIRRFLLPTGEYVSCVLWYVCAEPALAPNPANARAGTTSSTSPAPTSCDACPSDSRPSAAP